MLDIATAMIPVMTAQFSAQLAAKDPAVDRDMPDVIGWMMKSFTAGKRRIYEQVRLKTIRFQLEELDKITATKPARTPTRPPLEVPTAARAPVAEAPVPTKRPASAAPAVEKPARAKPQRAPDRPVPAVLVTEPDPISPDAGPIDDPSRQRFIQRLRKQNRYSVQTRSDGQVIRISISKSDLTDTEFQVICSFSHLQRLDLNDTSFPVQSLAHLVHLRSLRVLQLSGASVDSKAIAGLPHGLPIDSLLLNRSRITDQDLQHLLKYRKLKLLDLRGTGVSAKGVQNLRQQTNIARILTEESK